MEHLFLLISLLLLLLLLCFSTGLSRHSSTIESLHSHARILRLHPGDDLKASLRLSAEAGNLQAATLVSGIGSLCSVHLRLAGFSGNSSNDKSNSNNQFLQETGHYEIVSLSGTVSVNRLHIHMSISGPNGEVRGGHLMDGCVVHTTAEITLLIHDDVVFTGEYDDETSFNELSMRKSTSALSSNSQGRGEEEHIPTAEDLPDL